MPYEQLQAGPARAHMLTVDNRKSLSITGVDDVAGFDESTVVLTTALGELTVRGRELHIEKIDLEQGQLELTGHIQLLSYDEPMERAGFFRRLFG